MIPVHGPGLIEWKPPPGGIGAEVSQSVDFLKANSG